MDHTTLVTSRGKFTQVCVEIDLSKPLKAGYRLRNQTWKFQYEGLHALCFHRGKYGHMEAGCPEKIKIEGRGQTGSDHPSVNRVAERSESLAMDHQKQQAPSFGDWMIAQTRGRQSVGSTQENDGGSTRRPGGANRGSNRETTLQSCATNQGIQRGYQIRNRLDQDSVFLLI